MFCFFPGFIQSKEASLAATLDQLIGLRDEFGGMDPGRKLGIWCDRTGLRIPRDLGDLWGRENEVWGDSSGWMDLGSAFEPEGKKQLRIVFADSWIKERVRWWNGKREKEADPLQTFTGEGWRGKREGDGRKIYLRDGLYRQIRPRPPTDIELLI